MQKKILAANWKMNLLQTEVNAWIQTFSAFKCLSDTVETRVYPGAIYLKDFQATALHAGAQNVYFEKQGAYTGELSIVQLRSIGVQSVLIGHSERRQLFLEDNKFISQKVKACLQHDFPFILCCGEDIQTRNEAQHLDFVIEQLGNNLDGMTADQLDLLVVAYEPIWAIGAGLSANMAQISEMHEAIRVFLQSKFGAAAAEVPILYGGSVNSGNATEIFSCPNVDGALVGGAALDPSAFYQLWQALNV